jgi:hypothetical protein
MDGLLDSFLPGRLSEIVGPRSSGSSGLLLAVLAHTTGAGRRVALVDGADTFDAPSAHEAGVDLDRLLWVRCGRHWSKAWSAADLLIRCGAFGTVALELGGIEPGRRDPGSAVRAIRLQRAVERSATTLVLHTPYHLAGHAAALVVEVRRVATRWVGQPRPTRLAGLVSEARIVRSRARPVRLREPVAPPRPADPLREFADAPSTSICPDAAPAPADVGVHATLPGEGAGWLLEWRL